MWREDGYVVKTSLSDSERTQIYRLRSSVFCRELGWTQEDATGMERDEFDRGCTHIAVFSPARDLIATARVAFAAQPWMLDRYFRMLTPPNGALERRSHASEISRLATDRGFRNRRLPAGFSVADLAYKALFNLCMLHDVHLSYAVVTPAMCRHMRTRSLVVTDLGAYRRMDDGVEAGLVEVNWKSFVVQNRRHNPELLRWYTNWKLSARPAR